MTDLHGYGVASYDPLWLMIPHLRPQAGWVVVPHPSGKADEWRRPTR